MLDCVMTTVRAGKSTPAANVVPRARAAGAKVIIVNNEPTDRDHYATALVRGDIGQLLPALVGYVE